MKFSDREGITHHKNALQIDSMDDALANGIWNVIEARIFDNVDFQRFSLNYLFRNIWVNFFKQKINNEPYRTSSWIDGLLNWYDHSQWYDKYNFIEFIAQDQRVISLIPMFEPLVNIVLEDEKSAYRFVDHWIVPVIGDEQIKSIEEATQTKRESVAQRIDNALMDLSNKQNNDYRGVIKESIDAVEDMCRYITRADDKTKEQNTLGDALNEIERKSGVEIHPTLKIAFDKLYAYTNKSDVRHPALDPEPVDQETAIYMLVSCSAFINYLQVKADKAGIDIES